MTEIFSRNHRKQKNYFSCGKALLDSYLKFQAGQDVKRKLAACFVSVDDQTGLIEGYYTLSNNSIPIGLVPEWYKNHLPESYHSIPTTLIGRLAVDERFKGQGIGEMLLIDALLRSYKVSASIGSFAVVVDPLDKEAQSFYEKYGFIQLPDSQKMFLPMKTIQILFDKKQ